MRKIIHIDMDAFYASVEQRDFPEYRNKPLVVGGDPNSRGVVATASYEARKFGIHSAMACSTAYKLCPHAIFVYPRFDVYSSVSKSIREIFSRYTDLVEPLSFYEAYLDITEDKLNIGSALDIALEIKNAIKNELGLTASAGVSVNKFVAKIASDMNKPDGITFIGPSKIQSFIAKLPVEKFYGVGKVTAHKMKVMQLHTGADLKKLSEQQMIHSFGKTGKFYYTIVRGIDDRPVQPHRETKSVSAEDTFSEDTSDPVLLREFMVKVCEQLAKRLQKNGLSGRTVTIKIKFEDFTLLTRSASLNKLMNKADEIFTIAQRLLESMPPTSKKIRLLGVGISNFALLEKPDKSINDQLKLKL